MKAKRLLFILVITLVLLGGCFISVRQDRQRPGSRLEFPAKAISAEAYSNRLTKEKSPYLLQHAHNPVDWYPWGEEAFKKAKADDKPIFLSVGYSTCHWCHVMEEESFSKPEIAKIMNENFVSIKVDREERPDVDSIYMAAVQAMTGQGGWPMSVFLTPDRKPFYGGTYFPPEDRWGRPGFAAVLKSIAQKWKDSRGEILDSGNSLSEAIQAQSRKLGNSSVALDESVLKKGFEQFRSRFDSRYGGFGGAPRFPTSHNLSFLLRYWKRTGDAQALAMAGKTLEEISKGGIHDHIGGGFHRYSTDGRWHVPHFEKMLYDQALLSRAYLEAYQSTGKEIYAQTARDIFEYVLRDMTGPEGAFYSAEDADSAPDPSKPHEKTEGAFYVWSHEEITGILGEKEGTLFNFVYGVKPGGNAASDPHGEFKKKNILYEAHSPEEASKEFGMSLSDVARGLTLARGKLFEERGKRLRPHLDDKILTDWNGLMISSLAFGSRVLDEPRYRDAAGKAADFILGSMRTKDGRLLHRYREKEAGIPAFLDDYAFFSNGLFDLYEATFDPRYLEEARGLLRRAGGDFWDKETGGFYLTAHDSEKLITRTKELYDGALPSGNSVAALALLRVGRLTMDGALEALARQALSAFSEAVSQYPSAHSQMLIALDFAIGPSHEIVVAGEKDDGSVREMTREIYKSFLPNKVVALHPRAGPAAEKIESLSPFVKEQTALGGKATAYVCKNYVCSLPTTDVKKLKELLGG